ncbi:hypothetical protein BKA70DRAFT_1287427 [Coprinopsis sp. MPI-PUGE-AT-0042]|nr:hypothetical protein BKA70DRAFT_1287427 [Coprinopsis sp. MPI-PUGE-AT-0042]
MKFTAAFAVLTVFASKAVVQAAPAPSYDSIMEARSEFVESALEEVWARFYDELLEEVEARRYDEDIFERSPMMKKFAVDLATGLAQKAPGYADKYKKSEEAKIKNAQPRLAKVVKQAQIAAKPVQAPPKMALPPSSKWNTVKKPGVMDEIKKLRAGKK